MIGFALLLGHFVGDYILQEDWQAKNKVNPHPGPCPYSVFDVLCEEDGKPMSPEAQEWETRCNAWWLGHVACTLHCFLYTLAVLAMTAPIHMYPWWFYLATGLAHWPIDRFRLARVWMERVSGQKVFASAMAPWSIILVDNTFHLLTLYGLALLEGVVSQ